MQYVLLLVFNIIIGAVLYLIISLKLERSATEFREKKLRREMDAIISEFNSTAERNISILESKIQVLKRLLERVGDLKSLDITVGEEDISPANGGEFNIRELEGNVRADLEDQGITPRKRDIREKNTSQLIPEIKKRLILISSTFMNIFRRSRNHDEISLPRSDSVRFFDQIDMIKSTDEEPIHVKSDDSDSNIIAKDLSLPSLLPADDESDLQEEKDIPLSGEDINRMMADAEDKYSVISELHEKGCTLEDISKHSGIPMGEVRLVLNLNSSR